MDKNRARLIQTVTLVKTIADQMFGEKIIHKETYANIEAAGTSMEQMRELYKALTCTEAKSAFYRILQEVEPKTCEGMRSFNQTLYKCYACKKILQVLYNFLSIFYY